MSKVHRYRAVDLLTEDGKYINYHSGGPEVVLATSFDRVTAERDGLQVRVNELREDFQELSEQSERRGRQASEFEDRMGELQVENGKLKDRITLLSDSGEHVESHLEKQTDILRIRCDALQVLLTAADERADLLESALRELLSGTGTSPGANKKYGKARAVLEGSRKKSDSRICSPANPHNYHLGECTKCGAISPTE